MYSLPYFKEKDPQVVLDFIKRHPFAMLIASNNDLPVATQVPLLLEEKEGKLFLHGHVMKNTDHHNALSQNPNVLCVFSGAHTYVSAGWYHNPQTASTWNYISVHARGKIKFLDEAQLLKILEKTTAHFENDPASPASFDKLPEEYVRRLAKAIIAFEIEVEHLENVFKLSQNRDQKSYSNIITQLKEQDADAKEIAVEMENRYDSLFNRSL